MGAPSDTDPVIGLSHTAVKAVFKSKTGESLQNWKLEWGEGPSPSQWNGASDGGQLSVHSSSTTR